MNEPDFYAKLATCRMYYTSHSCCDNVPAKYIESHDIEEKQINKNHGEGP